MATQQQSPEEYSRIRALEKTHVCAQCGASIVTIHNNDTASWVSACGTNKSHRGIKQRPTNEQMLKRGELDAELGDGAQMGMEKFYETRPGSSPLMPTEDLVTRAVLSPVQIRELEIFADSVHLKAFLGHVCLYFGKPYITIDGYYYLKNKLGLGFAVCTFPMTPKERTSYQIADGDHAYLARAITSEGDVLNAGIGIVTLKEMSEKSRKNPESFAAPVVHNKPQIMAEKRAEWQLMQKMIPLGVDIPPDEPTPRGPLPKPPISDSQIADWYR